MIPVAPPGFHFVTRFEAITVCASCSWSAKMTADTAPEALAFLRRLLFTHVAEQHPRPERRPS